MILKRKTFCHKNLISNFTIKKKKSVNYKLYFGEIQIRELIILSLQKRLLLATARVHHNNTKSRHRLVVPTAKGRQLPSVKALSVILYYRQGRR